MKYYPRGSRIPALLLSVFLLVSCGLTETAAPTTASNETKNTDQGDVTREEVPDEDNGVLLLYGIPEADESVPEVLTTETLPVSFEENPAEVSSVEEIPLPVLPSEESAAEEPILIEPPEEQTQTAPEEQSWEQTWTPPEEQSWEQTWTAPEEQSWEQTWTPDPEPTWTPLVPDEDTSQGSSVTREGPEDPYWLQNTYEHKAAQSYVLNKNTKKIHKPTCRDVSRIKPENYATTDDPAAYQAMGYTNCGHCGGY